ncbi:MAG: Pr6Pr family membrane protein [Candidatus Helarchaeota archaeon]
MNEIDAMKLEKQKSFISAWIIRLIRFLILGFSWSSFIIIFILSSDFGFTFSTYTIQSNLMVLTWLTLAILFQKKYKEHWFFSEGVRGAITLYISVTFIIFAILLAPLYHPTGIDAYQNIILHYFIPSAFIIDWIFTEIRRNYKWKYVVYWLAYPLFYLVFTIIRGVITDNYIYPFLDLNAFGVPIFTAICFALAGFFLALGALYVFISKKIK